MINYLIIFVVKLIFKLLITFFLEKKIITFLDYCTLSICLDRNDFSSVCFFLFLFSFFLAPLALFMGHE